MKPRPAQIARLHARPLVPHHSDAALALEATYLSVLGGWTAVPFRTDTAREQGEPDPDQVLILQQIDGRATVHDIADGSPFAPVDVLRILCELLQRDVIGMS